MPEVMNREIIKQVFNERGYKFFHGHLNVNIVGVRMNEYRMNHFDDFLFLSYEDELGMPITLQWPITTRPGLSVLKSPINAKGTAILVPDQYRSVYKIDKHNGRYDAVCQRNGVVTVYRDNDRDNEFDYSPDTWDSGYFGINIHKAGWASAIVNGWSAGCQVFQYAQDFDLFMAIVKRSVRIYGNSLTYTLIEEKDFEGLTF